MQLVECILIEDCLAPKSKLNSVNKKGFRKGNRVVGVVESFQLSPESNILALKTKEGYIIPEPFLNVIGAVASDGNETEEHDEIPYAEVVDNKKEYSTTQKKIVDSISSIKQTNVKSDTKHKSKHTVNFAIGGGIIGLGFAMAKGKNKLVFTTLGIVCGGFIGNQLGDKKKN
jgi:hypothetical protein